MKPTELAIAAVVLWRWHCRLALFALLRTESSPLSLAPVLLGAISPPSVESADRPIVAGKI